MVAWRQNDADDDQDGARMQLQGVHARAGRFEGAPTTSANDLVAVLFLLLLIRYWICAKYIAKLLVLHMLLRKINAARIFAVLPRNPHQMGRAGFSPDCSTCAISITSPHFPVAPSGPTPGSAQP